MKTPGPDHPISVEPAKNQVVVTLDGQTIADSTSALVMHEADYPPVYYLPRGDTDMSLLLPTSRATHCPYKGDASYFSIVGRTATAENAVWTYEDPLPAAAAIRGHLAFYPDRVTIEVSSTD